MLKFYRKNIKLIIWLIVLSFVAWGVGTISLSKESASPYIGSVRGEKISHKEFLTTLRYYDLLTRNQADEAGSGASDSEPIPFETLRALSWQVIILSREAEREGIAVSDEEVRKEVERLFSAGGELNQKFYQNWIQGHFQGRARDFEEAVRKDLAARAIRKKILEGVPQEEREARWREWLGSTFKEAKIKDYTAEARSKGNS